MRYSAMLAGADKMRILLVDDDPIIRDLLSSSLAREGFSDITLACSAEQAMKLIDSDDDTFDCFLLDIMLEGMSGIELCGWLRQHPELRAAPVIMITSSQATAFMDQAFDAGATDFLRKPLDQAEVAGRIRTAMLLVETTEQERRGREALRALMSHAGEFDLIDTSQRICFPDVPRMLDYFQFENRLLRLKEGQYQMSLVRLQLDALDGQRERDDWAGILNLIHTISVKVGKTIQVRRFWFAYIGAGRFIFCTIGPSGPISPTISERIQEIAHEAVRQSVQEEKTEIHASVESLAETPIVSQKTALGIVRKEFDVVARASAASLPKIDIIENHLFAKIDNIFSTACHEE